VGLRPPIRATCFRAKTQYILPSSQMQDTPKIIPALPFSERVSEPTLAVLLSAHA
jgi:hypothetical protein